MGENGVGYTSCKPQTYPHVHVQQITFTLHLQLFITRKIIRICKRDTTGYFQGDLRTFPAVFFATKTGKPKKINVFLNLTKGFLCLNLTRA